LFADSSKAGGVHLNIGTGNNAEDTGIELRFVRPDRVRKMAEEEDRRFNEAAKVAKVIEGFPEPMLKPL
jgi:hypothetical protein